MLIDLGYLTVPPGVYFSGSFTVSAWVKVNSIRDMARIIDFGNGPESNNVYFGVSLSTSGKPFVGILPNGVRYIASSQALSNYYWYHLTGIYDGAYIKIYQNGKLEGQVAVLGPQNVIRNINYVGKSSWASNSLADEYLSDLRIYDRALNYTEIQNNMNDINF